MKTKARFLVSLKIWVVIYPSITLFLYLFAGLLSGLALPVRTLILTLVLVPWVVFVGVPVVDWLMQMFSPSDSNQSIKDH